MINRNISPTQTKGIYSGPNPSFGNYLSGNLDQNSRVNYPGTAAVDTNGEDAWMNFPARVQTQAATSNPALMQPGSNLDAVSPEVMSLTQSAGLHAGLVTGNPQGTGYMPSGI